MIPSPRRPARFLVALSVLGLFLAGCGASSVPGLPPTTLYTIQGSVTNDAGGPVAWSGIALEGTPLGTVTNNSGAFTFNAVRPGAYRMVVIYAGFRSQEVTFKLPEDSSVERSVMMARDRRAGVATADSMAAINLTFTARGAN